MSSIDSTVWRCSLAKKLLAWFDENARDLPWRRTRDLYAIWISEVMLQQTQVATVIPYWRRFMDCFPDAASLATTDEQEVLRRWEGLGYYRRARQLHAAAKKIVAEHKGQFPTTPDAVRSLPGVGRYTAGAILSIGQDQRLPILEANTIRVLARITAFRGDTTTTAGQRYLWTVAEAILPDERCGAFNQALMELGSEICTARSPACDRCPIAKLCESHRRRLVTRIPAPRKQKNYEEVTEVAVVARHRGRLLLRQCQPTERWAGLWDYPRFPLLCNDRLTSPQRRKVAAQVRELTGVSIIPGGHLTTLKHGVTRFRITLRCFEATLKRNNSDACWLPLAALADYPLTRTARKITQLLAASR